MCRTAGRRCESKWGAQRKPMEAARKGYTRNRAKAEQARAGGDEDAALRYDSLAAEHALRFEGLHAQVTGVASGGAGDHVEDHPDLAQMAREADAAGIRKLVDVPMADFAPPEVRERLLSEEYAQICARERELGAALEALEASEKAGPEDYHRALDAHRAARAEMMDYRIQTALMLQEANTTEAQFVLREGLSPVVEAETGSREWLLARQQTLGGSDVGSICKVGEWGRNSYERCREAHMDLDPQDQVHEGASMVGDLWEPHLLSAASAALGKPVYVNKTTYSDGKRHANLDGFTLDGDDISGGSRMETVVEIKTSSRPGEWENSAPEGYVLQTQHYEDIHQARSGIVVANINDERLVIYRVDPTDKVPAGPSSIKKLGDSFSYSDVREYAEGMVQKWNSDREVARAGEEPVKRRSFEMSDEERGTWRRALDNGVIFVDLETSHMSQRRGHVIEFGGMDENGQEFQRLYGVPSDHARWNGTGSVEVHGITTEMVQERPVLLYDESSKEEIRAFIGDRVVVAHNAEFENRWLSEAGVKVETADTMRAFGAVVKDEGIADNSMSSFTQWAGVEYRDAHRAMPDVRMMAEAFGKLRPLLEREVRPS